MITPTNITADEFVLVECDRCKAYAYYVGRPVVDGRTSFGAATFIHDQKADQTLCVYCRSIDRMNEKLGCR